MTMGYGIGMGFGLAWMFLIGLLVVLAIVALAKYIAK
jgi:hypothetical protein